MVSGSSAKLTSVSPSRTYKLQHYYANTKALLHAHAHAGYTSLNKDVFIILSRFMMLLFLFICLFVCFLRLEVGGRTGH